MKEKHSQEVKGKLVARSAWWVRRPDHWGCESESPVVECQVVWPGGWLKREVIWLMFPPFIALLSTSSSLPPASVLPNRQKKKPPQKTLRWCHSYAKQACFQRGECVCACVCERLCVCVHVLLERLIPLLEGPLHLPVNSQKTWEKLAD